MNRFSVIVLFAAFALASSAQPQKVAPKPGGSDRLHPVPRMVGGPLIPGLFLASRPDVQKEIHMTAAQKTALEKCRKEMNVDWSGAVDTRKLAETHKRANAIFNTTQKNRLRELAYQTAGGFALQAADVKKALGITDAQSKKMFSVREQGMTKFQQAARANGGKGGPNPAITAWIKNGLVNVLTPAQKAKWKAMQGRPFRFDPKYDPKPPKAPTVRKAG
jgi:hypothetical protein